MNLADRSMSHHNVDSDSYLPGRQRTVPRNNTDHPWNITLLWDSFHYQ